MRMNKERTLILVIVITLLVILVSEWMKPLPVNWSQSYSNRDTIPYGASGLFRVLPELFPESDINTIHEPGYEWLGRRDQDEDNRTILFFLNNILNPDQYETRLLLDFAEAGGVVFMSAEQFSDPLADSLGFSIGGGMLSGMGLRGFDLLEDFDDPDSTGISLNGESPGEGRRVYRFPSFLAASAFTSYDTVRTRLFGYNEYGDPNFLGIEHGGGSFILHSVPAALTNYFLVDQQLEGYIWEVLSKLPDRNIYWDEYHKVLTAEARTPLRFILSIDTLRYSLYLGLFTLIMFIIFFAKRRQAIIPLHSRPANATVAFVKTVTNLFFTRADHKDIAERKIFYLHDYFRSTLGLGNTPGDIFTPSLVAARSGVDEQEITELIAAISNVHEKNFIGANELKSLNTQIENFYKSTQR
jgi:hypothetical protein